MKNIKKSSHLAVAPIIATLLMVAVAVVGGILIFVFTQGFFADEQVTGFKADSLFVSGYNAKDSHSTDLDSSNSATMQCPNASFDGKLSSGDCILLFVDNRGPDPLAIGEVRVYGTSYSPSINTTLASNPAGGAICDDGKKSGGSTIDDAEFRVYTSASTPQNNLIVEPNSSSVICVTYNGNDVKAGKVIPVQIITENGQILLENVRNGARGTSETGTFTALGGLTVPTGTSNFAAVADGDDEKINLTWSLLDNQGLTTTYVVTRTSPSGFTSTTCSSLTPTSTGCQDELSICASANSYSLAASNSAGSWVPSGGDDTASVTDGTETTPVAPTAIAYVNSPGEYSGTTNGQLPFTWTSGANEDGNCSQSFSFTISTNSGSIDSQANDNSATVTGLSDGASGTITIAVENAAGSAQTQQAFTFDADCSGLTANTPTITDNNDGTVSVTWSTHSEPASGCDASKTFDMLTSTDGGGYSSATTTDDGSHNNFGSFNNGQTVDARVTVSNEDSASNSANSAQTTIDLDCSAAGSPVNPSITGADTSATLNWGSVTPLSGCTGLTYEAKYNINDAGFVSAVSGTVATSFGTLDFCGLGGSNGDDVDLKIIATFGGGPSADGTTEVTGLTVKTLSTCV